jgi:serine/threonine protein kinase
MLFEMECDWILYDKKKKEWRHCLNPLTDSDIYCTFHRNWLTRRSLTVQSKPQGYILQCIRQVASVHSTPPTTHSTPQAASAYSTPPTATSTPQAATLATPVRKSLQKSNSIPYRLNYKSLPNAPLVDRCNVFCLNLSEELTLVKLGCETKIDGLFGQLKNADAYRYKLQEVAEKLKLTGQWTKWLAEMRGSYKSEEPLKPQGLFYDLMVKAQSLLIESFTEQKLGQEQVFHEIPHRFRNLLREKIGHKFEHDEAERVKSLNPDIVVVKQKYQDSDFPDFGRFLCVMEHKRGEKEMSNSAAKIESLVRSTQTFNDNPYRHYLYSVFVAGTKLRLFQLNRGGVVYFGNDLDIGKNLETFLKFVAWLSFASPQQFGRGKHIDSIGGVEFKCFWEKSVQFVRPEALDSRGTTVWHAWEPVKTKGLEEDLARLEVSDKPQTEPQMILKMQWAHELRKATEADVLKAISNMRGVPKFYGECRGPSTKDFFESYLGTERKPIKSNAISTPANITIAPSSYEPLGSRSGTHSHKPLNAQPAPSSPRANNHSFREQRWILTSYCGASIDDEEDPISKRQFTTVDRIRTLHSVIHTIRNLFCDKRIIHRDISSSNVRIAPLSTAYKDYADVKPLPDSTNEVELAGYLIDFDMATFWDSEGSGARSRTGTPLYMALAVLSAVPPSFHLPWYDIESVFWLLLIGEGQRAGLSSFRFQDGMDLEDLGSKKARLISNTSWEKLKKLKFMQGHVGLLLCRLRGYLFDYNWAQTAEVVDRITQDELYEAERFQTSVQDDIKVLGENIANALNEAINIIDKWFRECIDGLQKDG